MHYYGESTLRNLQRAPELAIDAEVLAAWAAGNDTAQIARMVGEPEALVASRVPRVVEAARRAA